MEPDQEITINGIKYIREDLQQPYRLNGLEYVIVRTCSAGVFAGYIYSQTGQEVVLKDARRIWYWEGAASLSQLAVSGTSKPDKCKFPESVNRIKLLQAIEILICTEAAKKSIAAVKIWRQ